MDSLVLINPVITSSEHDNSIKVFLCSCASVSLDDRIYVEIPLLSQNQYRKSQ